MVFVFVCSKLTFNNKCFLVVNYSGYVRGGRILIRLPFRMLVRKYGCDVAFTPMIVSHSFIESEKARHSDLTTSEVTEWLSEPHHQEVSFESTKLNKCLHSYLMSKICDRPLIVQFAARQGSELADAAEIVFRYSDGVDLNCGCPQRWAITDGYGACLLKKPEVVHDMIQQVQNRIPNSKYTVSLKIRIHDNISETVEFCRRAEKAGASWISVHGRTQAQRNAAVNLDAIKLIKENLTIPVVGNGDVFHLRDAAKFQSSTAVNGIMSARGLLQNPSLFSGTEMTTPICIKDWISLSLSLGITFTTMHHHLIYMLEKVMPKHERKLFNSHTALTSVLDHLNDYYL